LKEIICNHQGEISAAAQEIVDFCQHERIWIFKGRMGAGKTTFIKEIARLMGVGDLVSSPSFSIINEYINDQGQSFYHFDFFRVNQQEEAFELGVEEYFYSGNYCWIEWPEKISDYIPEKFALISIEVGNNDKREISLQIIDDGKS
jgi:tRNA threonylcarbamoyladenosine biosynthesis protein TsaE